jgi:hypothetical protein
MHLDKKLYADLQRGIAVVLPSTCFLISRSNIRINIEFEKVNAAESILNSWRA